MIFKPDTTNASKAEKLIDEIIAAVRAADYGRAALLANSVLALGHHHPMVYNARALAFQQKGQHDEALAEFTQARTLSPDDANLQNAIGVCLISLNRPLEALQAFDSAIARDPKNAQFHYRKGWTLELLGGGENSIAHYERAVSLDPNHADALSSLAAARATAGKTEDAKRLADHALRINPNQATAIVALGIIDLAQENFEAAEHRFRSVVDTAPMTLRARAILQGLLADALEGQNRIPEAFASYELEKRQIRELYADAYANLPRPRETVDRITFHVENSKREASPTAASKVSSPARTHVFLLGFPRSGTTLLEQVLATHPDVIALEEQDLLADTAQLFLTDDEGLSRLATDNGTEFEFHRSAYWRTIERLGFDVGGKVIVDKLPMNTIKLPLIAKLFPDARIIFALRDPRDVVQSCYRRHFEINAANFEFLSLEGAAGLYASVMRLGAACREKLLLSEHLHRYEDMIADFDKSTASVCNFIGVEWSASLREFHTRSLLPVASPSAAQIRRPLYAEGTGRWRRYADQLAPVRPILEPWIEKFGYPKE